MQPIIILKKNVSIAEAAPKGEGTQTKGQEQ